MCCHHAQILLAMMLMVNGIVSFAVMHIFSLPDNKIWIAFALLLLGMAVSHLMQVRAGLKLHMHRAGWSPSCSCWRIL